MDPLNESLFDAQDLEAPAALAAALAPQAAPGHFDELGGGATPEDETRQAVPSQPAPLYDASGPRPETPPAQSNDDADDRAALAPAWSGFFENLGPGGFDDLPRRAISLERQIQDMQPSNPGSDQLVTFGSFDATFNVAAKGNLYVADLSYDIAGKYGWFSGIKLYGDYSGFDKSEPDFDDSQRFIVGTSFSLKDLWIAVEWLHGKNDNYIGASNFTQSLGAGGSNQWENQLYANIGYYF